MTTPTWDGLLEAAPFSEHHLAARQKLADMAKAGDWQGVLALIGNGNGSLSPNAWRPGGVSLYTPLHQAAWHGAPLAVVERMVNLGAWRTLRTAKKQRALDIATEKGHGPLLEALRPVVHQKIDTHTSERIDTHLAALVEARIRPHITLALRHPTCDVLTEIVDGKLWYPIPGMAGGFSIQLREHHLYVESWSRVVGGSGQAHIVTTDGYTLVDKGFV